MYIYIPTAVKNTGVKSPNKVLLLLTSSVLTLTQVIQINESSAQGISGIQSLHRKKTILSN